MFHLNDYTITNTNLLQICISRKPVVEAGADPERGAMPPLLKPAKVTLFTMILYNLENNIRNIRTVCRPLFGHSSVWSMLHLSYSREVAMRLDYQIFQKSIPHLLAGSAPGSRLLWHYRPLSTGLPALTSRRLSSSVSPAIRFLFLDLTCFILETVLLHTYVFQTSSLVKHR